MRKEVYEGEKYRELFKRLNWDDRFLLIDVVRDVVSTTIDNLAEARKEE